MDFLLYLQIHVLMKVSVSWYVKVFKNKELLTEISS